MAECCEKKEQSEEPVSKGFYSPTGNFLLVIKFVFQKEAWNVLSAWKNVSILLNYLVAISSVFFV